MFNPIPIFKSHGTMLQAYEKHRRMGRIAFLLKSSLLGCVDVFVQGGPKNRPEGIKPEQFISKLSIAFAQYQRM
jgi:hypothetical protein